MEKTINDIRKCKSCDHVAPISTYPPANRNAFGKSLYCRECIRAYKKKYSKSHSEFGRKCNSCKTIKTYDKYPVKNARICTQCVQSRPSAYQIKSKEKKDIATKYVIYDEYGVKYKDYIYKVSYQTLGMASTRKWRRVNKIERGEMVQCDNCFEYRDIDRINVMSNAKQVCSYCVRHNEWDDHLVVEASKKGK